MYCFAAPAIVPQVAIFFIQEEIAEGQTPANEIPPISTGWTIDVPPLSFRSRTVWRLVTRYDSHFSPKLIGGE
jgi:hypothetical protein